MLLELATTAVVDEHTIDLEEFDDGRRLETLVGTGTFAQVHAELLAQGVAEDVIGRLKPWAAMLKTTRIASEDGDGSLDQNLLLAGRARRLSVGSLELLEEQVAAFDAIPIDSQVALLKDALAHREQRSRSVEPTIDAWLHGDLAGLAEMFEARCKADPEMEYHYRQLAKHLIEDRTIVMHHRLYFPLRQGRVFVAVGAMHLHGESGLLALLRQDGYAVTRMW